MLDKDSRRKIMDAFGNELNNLARELYSVRRDGVSATQEPEITSRLCQRAEDRLDGKRAGKYVLRVSAQSMPDRGSKSIERITGADIFLSVSLDGQDGFDKGLFIQAKYDRDANREELIKNCDRMTSQVGAEGAYVWIYTPSGISVLSPAQLRKSQEKSAAKITRARSIGGFTGRILDCFAGSQNQGVPRGVDRRKFIRERFWELHTKNALDLSVTLD
jgi:hypothetical protein